ncbi:alpha-N-arabinofuranosidase [Brachybacterium massiliense]|uniref:arabinosylfuranosidase ArfA n=1 Tax=Brachybacterium massiliense TaxID=1755098 RepID=UPI000B3BCD26|nr:alpha-N-arabinofuranosidase [Brachybacterium massiliense]
MSLHGRLTLHPAFRIAPVRPRTFGAFVEHMGRCVYTGIFEPGHPRADSDGLRTDVLELTRELGVSAVRYPGGNFVSGYRWEDGVGPVEERPARRDLAWHSTEPNTFGVDEFMSWTEGADVEPMMAVNLGTRGIEEAVDLLEYCNGEAGTALADQRVRNGRTEPYGIRMWCLGNEMDGPWQLGHVPAEDYARLAAGTARAMRRAEEDLELIGCGSSHWAMDTFGDWERAVLEASYDEIDMISAHVYHQERDGDSASYLAVADDMDGYIDAVVATCDHVRGSLKRDKRIMISFDEWNVINTEGDTGEEPSGKDWPVAPRFAESTYTAQDAVVLGSLLISLLRHSDRVASASLAQLVNVLAPIRTEPGGSAWRQTIFHPFALTSKHASGDVLRPQIDSPTFENRRFGTSAVLDAACTWDEEAGELTVFAVNRSLEEPLALEVPLEGFGDLTLVEGTMLHESDRHARNTAEAPDAVVPRPLPDARLDDSSVTATLPPVSWTMLRLQATAL